MPGDTHFVSVLAPSTVTQDATISMTFRPGARFTAWRGVVKVGTVTGTSPTLNVYLQGAMRMSDGSYIWTDYASFKQLTSSNTEAWLSKVSSGEESHNGSDAQLTAEAVREGPIPSVLRCKVDVGGTSPSFATTEIALEFYP